MQCWYRVALRGNGKAQAVVSYSQLCELPNPQRGFKILGGWDLEVAANHCREDFPGHSAVTPFDIDRLQAT